MLFGRRKSGFTKEVEDLEIPDEINLDKLQEEQNDTDVEVEVEEKKDLLDYLDELEDEDDEELVIDESLDSEEIEEIIIPREVLFSDYIRRRSNAAHLTSRRNLEKEEENLDDLLEELASNETCKDIVHIDGDKDKYYYSNEYMSDNYANIAVLVEEKNLPKTIAEMVRWNCKVYPCATPAYYFSNSPYLYTQAQIERALSVMENDEEYEDINELTTGNDVKYLYSTIHMSEKYARALAEGVEYGEYGYRNK